MSLLHVGFLVTEYLSIHRFQARESRAEMTPICCVVARKKRNSFFLPLHMHHDTCIVLYSNVKAYERSLYFPYTLLRQVYTLSIRR